MSTPVDVPVADLVDAARAGDAAAWDALVDRFGSRVRAVARSYRLGRADADDVFQVTWLRLVANLDSIREPERVGAWLVTTASHECLRLLRRSGRLVPGDDDWEETLVDDAADVDTGVLTTERDQALWAAMGMLTGACQRLLRLLAADPPPSYQEVSAVLHMPVGSIGPTRRRCLTHLREHLARITGGSDGSSR
ncbi:MAG TPA: sigma-70 family RNA polymerase sigma factor [Acidimicrobiales bacterium]